MLFLIEDNSEVRAYFGGTDAVTIVRRHHRMVPKASLWMTNGFAHEHKQVLNREQDTCSSASALADVKSDQTHLTLQGNLRAAKQ